MIYAMAIRPPTGTSTQLVTHTRPATCNFTNTAQCAWEWEPAFPETAAGYVV